ncbi:MAG TPA: hypothetical protein VEW74_02695 [Candidatus Nitrosotalea sp.]|nr:hypothetical protein [Candidatus Nitrosotalea sp.]
MTPKRTAIFAIHGISPIQRYAFQDQVASAFQCYLNAKAEAAGESSWSAAVHWPKVGGTAAASSENVVPSALRLYRGTDPESPTGPVFDVYEGYWSPLSKGKTTILSALKWLLNATFLGNSSTAAIPCTPKKLWSDVGYVVIFLGCALGACIVALGLGLTAWGLLIHLLPNAAGITFGTLVQDPIPTIFKLPLAAYLEFAIDVVIGYVGAQLWVAYRASRARDARTAIFKADARADGTFTDNVKRTQAFHKAIIRVLWGILVMLVLAAIGVSYVPGAPHADPPWLFALYVAALAASIGSLQIARAIADFAVGNALGDVQIYTTHDANSTFHSIREEIISTVVSALRCVLTAVDDSGAGYYDAIHIFGHSLGSTVGMDVLIRLRQMIEEDVLAMAQWNKIRSFTTFGTALEKTRFFFDVRQPTLNAAQDQWADDVYGRFFTDKSKVLDDPNNDAGIYWSNYWYFRDIVANEIKSYQSKVQIGTFNWSGKTCKICQNFLLPNNRGRLAWVHSDYLADTLFWMSAGPVLVSSAR